MSLCDDLLQDLTYDGTVDLNYFVVVNDRTLFRWDPISESLLECRSDDHSKHLRYCELLAGVGQICSSLSDIRQYGIERHWPNWNRVVQDLA